MIRTFWNLYALNTFFRFPCSSRANSQALSLSERGRMQRSHALHIFYAHKTLSSRFSKTTHHVDAT